VSLLSSPLKVGEASLSFRPGAGTGVASSDGSSRTVGGAPVASGGSFAALVNWRLTPLVLGLSLLLAFAFGALHALGPGHGKTITAAYLVGQEAKARQAVVAGIAVSFMHTLSVLTLGFVALVLFHSFPAERVYPWLGLLTGAVALGLGTTLLVVRVRARRRGLDPWHGHAHPGDREVRVAAPHRELAMVGAPAVGLGHGHAFDEADLGHAHDGNGLAHTHEIESPPRTISRRGLAALAVSGGILPSPTALVVLTGAIAYHRLGYGLGLIVAFSLGLASALIGIAILALRARSLVSRRLGSRLGGILPITSAAVIMGFGLFFLFRGVGQIA
jgi:nickel/cobalt exporter